MAGNQKAARIHRALGLLYGLGSTIFILFAFLIPSEIAPMISCVALFIVLSAMHYSISLGAKNGRNWARRASQVISIPMLVGFPIGTFVGGALLLASWDPWETS